MESAAQTIDSKSGFCYQTQIFHSTSPKPTLPPESKPLSVATYVFSLLNYNPPSPLSSLPALINPSTGQRISYAEYVNRVHCLATSLHHTFGLSNGDTAFILCPSSAKISILYMSLYSLGVIVSPANPASTKSELAHQIRICRPVIAFATSSTVHKLTGGLATILIDTPEFELQLKQADNTGDFPDLIEPRQSDVAAILYSSGTTGNVKGVAITHRNMIALVSYFYHTRSVRTAPNVVLYTVSLFHVFGLSQCLKAVVLGECVVILEKFDMTKMLKAVEEFRVTSLLAAPPVIVSLAKITNIAGGLVEKYDLRSLEGIYTGGAPLRKDVIAVVLRKFPNLRISQGYGLTETFAGVFRPALPHDSSPWGSAGKLIGCCEAKIVDPNTWKGLPPGSQGELWIRGPTIMKGYIGGEEADSKVLVSDGWLRTGDLCYIDQEGNLYVVDRLKGLIKYKGYQVAPAELEQLLQSHPEIVDAAVIPYPDEVAGEIPMAYVVRNTQGRLDEAQVIDFVGKQVAPYKKIRRVAFVSSIPKNASGKILRKDLQKLAVSKSSSRL